MRTEEIWEQHYIPKTTPETWPLIEAEASWQGIFNDKSKPTLGAVVFREDEDGSFYTEPFKLSQ